MNRKFVHFCSSSYFANTQVPESFRCRIQQRSEWPKFTGIVRRGLAELTIGFEPRDIFSCRYLSNFAWSLVKKWKKKLRPFWQRKGKNLACIAFIVWEFCVFRCTNHQLISKSSYTSLVALDSCESVHFLRNFSMLAFYG